MKLKEQIEVLKYLSWKLSSINIKSKILSAQKETIKAEEILERL